MRHAWYHVLATATAITRTTVDVGRVSVTYDQHYFDTPVPQPRQGQRVADRSGLRPWPCAVPLLQHLSEATVPALETSLGRPPRVLELGSGVGLLGIGLALATGAEVTLTDPGLPTRFSKGADSVSTLEFLRRNVALNNAPTARAEKLLWGDADDLDAFSRTPPYDLVVASEVLYEPSQYAALADTLAFFATDAIIGYKVRHGREQTFFDRCADDHGFRVTSEPLAGEKLSKDAVLATLRRPK
jgi:hypothetical protein